MQLFLVILFFLVYEYTPLPLCQPMLKILFCSKSIQFKLESGICLKLWPEQTNYHFLFHSVNSIIFTRVAVFEQHLANPFNALFIAYVLLLLPQIFCAFDPNPICKLDLHLILWFPICFIKFPLTNEDLNQTSYLNIKADRQIFVFFFWLSFLFVHCLHLSSNPFFVAMLTL